MFIENLMFKEKIGKYLYKTEGKSIQFTFF